MVKVLHIVENFDGQATEKWLSQALKAIQENEGDVDWSFFCTLDKPGKFSREIIEMGGEVFCSPKPVSELISFMKYLRKTVRDSSYDIIHCHQDLMSAVYLLATIGLPIRKRIVHVHNTSLALPTPNRLKASILQWIFKIICSLLADHVVGVSEEALRAFNRRVKGSRLSVIHCGINLLPYRETKISKAEFRDSVGLPCGATILLFVGRMIEYKNPCFILDILEQLPDDYSHVYAVFAGTGPLEEEVVRIANKKNISSRVKVLGWRDDILVIMQSCNLLIWPGIEKPMEGLGLGVVEAQAAGLQVVMSRNVPEEAIIISELVDVVPLAAGAKVWADAVVAVLGRSVPDRKESLRRVNKSSFSIASSALNIQKLYRV